MALGARLPSLALNSLLSLGGQVLQLLVLFLVTPVAVRSLGETTHGLYVLLASFAGYFSHLELGVSRALVTRLSEARGRGDPAGMRRLLSAALLFELAVFGAIAAILIALREPLLARFFDVPPGTAAEIRAAYTFAAWALPLSMAIAVLQAAASGLEDFALQTISTALVLLGTQGILLGIALSSRSLDHLFSLTLAFDAVALLAIWIALRRRGRELTWASPGWADLSALLREGVFFFGSAFAAFLLTYAMRPLAGATVGAEAVTHVFIAYRLCSVVPALLSAMTLVLIPHASAKRTGDLSGLLGRSTVLVLGLGAFPQIALAVLAPEVLAVWVGDAVSAGAAPLTRAIAIAYAISAVTVASTQIAFGLGLARSLMHLAIVNAVLVLLGSALSLTVGRTTVGIAGIGLSMIASQVVIAPLVLGVAARAARTSFARSAKELAAAAAPALACAGLLFVESASLRLVGVLILSLWWGSAEGRRLYELWLSRGATG